MDWKLEVVLVPVSDVDRAKAFYTEKLGFNQDLEVTQSEDVAFAQLTPPGSGCSITVEKGLVDMQPGSLQGLQLVVSDIHAAHRQLVERGVEVSEIRTYDREAASWRPLEGQPEQWNAFVFFEDPDGNGWTVQQGPAD
jgi:catechol 2,3-dioxygenase-like lactoylglutathione lyase family enzyme